MAKPLKLQNKPRIVPTQQGWFAIPGHGIPKQQRNLLLACAISFCNRLNNGRYPLRGSNDPR
ncbi:hypothetical protein ACL598_17735 [Bordetella bronchialis]|uniref:hypothetical protein n=1 Tax=Bordetella bronchialis TaxID=463025 RepID=UPI003D0028E3